MTPDAGRMVLPARMQSPGVAERTPVPQSIAFEMALHDGMPPHDVVEGGPDMHLPRAPQWTPPDTPPHVLDEFMRVITEPGPGSKAGRIMREGGVRRRPARTLWPEGYE